MILYGINGCDTIKKARKWLDANNLDYRFHDYRKDGVDAKQLRQWTKELGWEILLNRRGTTWRKLPEADREAINEKSALALMLKHSAIIKRPLLDTGKIRVIGFREEEYSELLL